MLWSNASLSNRSLCHEESYRFVTGGAITVLCCAVLGACGPPCAHWRIRFAAQLLGPSPAFAAPAESVCMDWSKDFWQLRRHGCTHGA